MEPPFFPRQQGPVAGVLNFLGLGGEDGSRPSNGVQPKKRLKIALENGGFTYRNGTFYIFYQDKWGLKHPSLWLWVGLGDSSRDGLETLVEAGRFWAEDHPKSA